MHPFLLQVPWSMSKPKLLQTCGEEDMCMQTPKKNLKNVKYIICHHGDNGPEDKCVSEKAIRDSSHGLFNNAHTPDNHCGSCHSLDYCGLIQKECPSTMCTLPVIAES